MGVSSNSGGDKPGERDAGYVSSSIDNAKTYSGRRGRDIEIGC